MYSFLSVLIIPDFYWVLPSSAQPNKPKPNLGSSWIEIGTKK